MLSVVDIPLETIEYLIAHRKITELMDMLGSTIGIIDDTISSYNTF